MRLLVETAHWLAGVTEPRHTLPRPWTLHAMLWEIDGAQKHLLSFQVYHFQPLVSTSGLRLLYDASAEQSGAGLYGLDSVNSMEEKQTKTKGRTKLGLSGKKH